MKLEILLETPEYKLFIDMDGVLANFNEGMTRALQTVFGPEWVHDEEEYERSSKYRNLMWKALDKYQEEHNGELWFELKPLEDAFELWAYICNYPVEVLSATGHAKYKAEDQKRRWFADYFDGSIRMNFTSKAAEKAKHAKPNHILIDDKPKAIDPWVAAGGIGILHTNTASTIQQLKALGL